MKFTIVGKQVEVTVVQAAFPNTAYPSTHFARNWVYLGSYTFDTSQMYVDYVELNNETLDMDNINQEMRSVIADSICFVNPAGPSAGCGPFFNGEPPEVSWSVTNDGSERVRVDWEADYFERFDIYRHISPSPVNWTLVNSITANNGVWIDTNVVNGTEYYYWLDVRACEPDNDLLLGPESVILGAPPIAPYNLQALPTEIECSKTGEPIVPTNVPVLLDWDVLFQEQINITYTVYRSNNANGTFLVIASGLTEPEFLDVTGRVDYFYKVTAVNSFGESFFSNIAEVDISTIDCKEW